MTMTKEKGLKMERSRLCDYDKTSNSDGLSIWYEKETDEIVCMVSEKEERGQVWICSVFVSPKYRHLGLCEALLDYADENFSHMMMEGKMLDCKTTENYLKEKLRMCKSIICKDCPLGKCECDETNLKISMQECIEIVQKWSDAHPRKTYLSDLLEKYPNAPLNEKSGTPMICPSDIGFHDIPECELQENCVCCWNQPVEEGKDD